jgi:hypothetical protein
VCACVRACVRVRVRACVRACVQAQHFSESLNTLKFAARAKRMKNRPIVNDVNVSGALSGRL